jgi:sulfonate transport system substrate-binding protein
MDPIQSSLIQSANNAFDIGFLGKTRPDLSGIYDLTLLNEVLTERGLKPIAEDAVGTSNTTVPLSNTNSTSNITIAEPNTPNTTNSNESNSN